MLITDRDVQILRDIALSHVMSRDQLISLGYFASVTRVNARLQHLCGEGLIRRLETPFCQQSLYVVTRRSADLVGAQVAALISGRSGTPRFLQHALSVTNTRIRLLERGATAWRFEQQVSVTFSAGGRQHEVRPDGLAVFPARRVLAVEVDLGHVAASKFRAKLASYDRFARAGACTSAWGVPTFRLLTLTTTACRATRLAALTPPDARFEHVATTYADFGVPSVGAWS